MARRKKEKRVPVLLLEDIIRTGNRGEVKKLKFGHALFLWRKNQALIINPHRFKNLNILQALSTKKIERKLKMIEDKKKAIENLVFQFNLKVGKHGEIYDSLSKEKIRKFLEEQGIEITKDAIILTNPIREAGNYDIEINLGLNQKAILKVIIREEKV